jgi:hypothetical protein
MGAIFIFEGNRCRFKWVNQYNDQAGGLLSWCRPINRYDAEKVIQRLSRAE